MSDLVPYNSWERELDAIKQELADRRAYRAGGSPHPVPLTNLAEKLRAIERAEAALQDIANQELTEQALRAMEQIAQDHQTYLSTDAKRYRQGGYS